VRPPGTVTRLETQFRGISLLATSRVPKAIALVYTARIVVIVNGPKFTHSFRRTQEGMWLITPFFACRYFNPFRRYSGSNSEVVRNRSKIWMFLALPNFRGPSPQRVVLKFSCLPCGTSREKFRELTPLDPKVIGAHTLNFAPIFEFCLYKIAGGPPTLVVCGLASLSRTQARVKFQEGAAPPRGRNIVFRNS